MNTYTILDEVSYTETFVDEGKVEGTLYTVELSNGTKTEVQKYFVRNTQTASDVLQEAANALN